MCVFLLVIYKCVCFSDIYVYVYVFMGDAHVYVSMVMHM